LLKGEEGYQRPLQALGIKLFLFYIQNIYIQTANIVFDERKDQ